MDMAITVDDLPAAGDLPLVLSRLDVIEQMIATFKKTPYFWNLWHDKRQ